MSTSFPIKFTLVAIDYLIHVVNMMTEYLQYWTNQIFLQEKDLQTFAWLGNVFTQQRKKNSFLSDWVLFGVSTFAPFFRFYRVESF